MRLPIVFQVLRHLLLVLLCLSSLWLVTPCLDISAKDDFKGLCIGGKRSPKQRRQNDNFSMKAVVEAAQTRAYLSPAVFLGSLRSVLVQRDGTIRAWFSLDNPLKTNNSFSGVQKKEDIEVVYYRSGEHCILEMNQDNLKLGKQYIIFGVLSGTNSWPSMAATALPIPNDKRTLRGVKKILCTDCAKPPSISGLEKVRVEEGSKVRLNCHLAGNPIPWVEWYKDGVKVTSKGRLRVKTKRRTSRLVIRRARPSDRGVYECRAGNIVQEEPSSAKTTVAVTRKKKTKRPLTTTSPATPSTTVSSTESSPWTTEPCPTSDFCLNGGTCVFYKVVREYVCYCAEGYIGLRCDYKDVSISVGEVKNLAQNHDRLFIDILVLFLIFFCLNWACLGICWLCCFRCQHKNWGKFREMAPLQKFFRSGKFLERGEEKTSVDVDLDLSGNQSNSKTEKESENYKREDNNVKSESSEA
ncbi:uncharacterized protein TNIN_397281 [Trichonephila inaurata madagascariensis]|uniref:Uncharacterized protein n=1 Tax=Trichonephila inaurata madagascariensis TaxID=2747483 RepID=A0A8X6YSX1_9ARAC|nr:uncharacterized protein TNIN_397281 [Trichonephila inaurata madagascariensis]